MSTSAFHRMLALVTERYPNFARPWIETHKEFGPCWEQEISHHIERVFGPEPGPAWDEAVDGYAEFCTEALRAHIFFERHGRYQASRYDEVKRACYMSADYMERRYLPGQYLSHYIWRHHHRMLRGYLDVVLPRFCDKADTFYEVGVGCGLYSQKTLELLDEASGTGIDISPYALRFTNRVVAAHGLGQRYQTLEKDILATDSLAPADFLICQEVLEHLEDPAGFVVRLAELVRPAGHAYITAAINAGHTDHIYLYRSPEEVASHVEAAGLRVLWKQVESTYPEKPPQFRPTIAAFLGQRD